MPEALQRILGLSSHRTTPFIPTMTCAASRSGSPARERLIPPFLAPRSAQTRCLGHVTRQGARGHGVKPYGPVDSRRASAWQIRCGNPEAGMRDRHSQSPVTQSGLVTWRRDDHEVPAVSRRARHGHLVITSCGAARSAGGRGHGRGPGLAGEAARGTARRSRSQGPVAHRLRAASARCQRSPGTKSCWRPAESAGKSSCGDLAQPRRVVTCLDHSQGSFRIQR